VTSEVEAREENSETTGEVEFAEESWVLVSHVPLKSFSYCVWGCGHLCKPDFLSFLDIVLRDCGLSVSKNVKGIKQVSQKDGQVRYDVVVN
jgi:hypothetical protein